MNQRISPTVIKSTADLGKVTRILRVFRGWSQSTAAKAHHCVPALISHREAGTRGFSIDAASQALDVHGYVLVCMHKDDALALLSREGHRDAVGAASP